MDNAPEGRRWTLFLRGIDFLDRVGEHGRASAVVALATALIYMLVGTRQDLLLNLLLLSYSYRSYLKPILHAAAQYVPLAVLGITIAAMCQFAAAILGGDKSVRPNPAKPFLIPCRTTHTRLFPRKHSFSYSYLTVGVPVGYKGNMNGLVETDLKRRTTVLGWLLRPFSWTWYSIKASDYLERGHDELDLREKLDRYIESEGIDPKTFPLAYLVTAPRFAGYSFNPVSFWFLYSKEKVLSAIISEVNNTFDERRSYLLLPGSVDENGTTSSTTGQSRLKASVDKDFHVSPFNSRKGTYSVLANDPLGKDMDGFRRLDVTITLSSSKGQPKLVARLASDGAGVDPMSLGFIGKQVFIAKWFWVGFATFPRIVKEAAVLFSRRKLHVWYRPEPLPSTAGRHATSNERNLEKCFRSYLEYLVTNSSADLTVKYIPAGLNDATEVVFASRCSANAEKTETLEIRILTPAFYSRFLHYSDNMVAILSELNDSRTISVNRPEQLPAVFSHGSPKPSGTASFTDSLFLQLVQATRRRPSPIPQSSTSADKPARVQRRHDDDYRVSPMDVHMATFGDAQLKFLYQWAATRRLVTKRYLKGKDYVIDAVLLLLRVALALAFTLSVTKIIHIID